MVGPVVAPKGAAMTVRPPAIRAPVGMLPAIATTTNALRPPDPDQWLLPHPPHPDTLQARTRTVHTSGAPPKDDENDPMARRGTTPLDDIARLPWPVGFAFALAAWLALRHGIPLLLKGQPLFVHIGELARRAAPIVTAPLLLASAAAWWRARPRRRLLETRSDLGSICAALFGLSPAEAKELLTAVQRRLTRAQPDAHVERGGSDAGRVAAPGLARSRVTAEEPRGVENSRLTCVNASIARSSTMSVRLSVSARPLSAAPFG